VSAARSWSDDELRARHRTSLRHFYRVLSHGSDTARVVELDGVVACVTPVVPERSFPNAVVYDHAGALGAALPALTRLYEDAGVRAWTVWVPEADTAAARVLEDAGHVLDANPMEMGAALDELDLEPRRELDLEPTPDAAMVGALNDAAYGLEDCFALAFARLPAGEAHLYVAREDGEAVASMGAMDLGGDCEIAMAATLPAARGRGLCGELMRLALREARERGCETTTLEATKAGEPIYSRIGYRSLGALQMWERRA
jgi:ribosomal protein S18 acetylase RimI-like enzyme